MSNPAITALTASITATAQAANITVAAQAVAETVLHTVQEEAATVTQAAAHHRVAEDLPAHIEEGKLVCGKQTV